jgi:hypothetical protein
MDTSLDSLDPRFKPLAILLLARLVEARIPIMIINTRRTATEQQAAIARGVSWVHHSKHEDGLAIDLAPYSVWSEVGGNKINWDPGDPQWLKMGVVGEAIPGLKWGGRWTVKDLGHFEFAGSNAPDGVPV